LLATRAEMQMAAVNIKGSLVNDIGDGSEVGGAEGIQIDEFRQDSIWRTVSQSAVSGSTVVTPVSVV